MKSNWTIHALERQAQDGFVLNVHWRLSMQDGEYYADTYGVISYTQDPEASDFVPFEQLTKEIVVGWVQDYFGEEKLNEMQESLINNINNQKNPPIILGLPWN